MTTTRDEGLQAGAQSTRTVRGVGRGSVANLAGTLVSALSTLVMTVVVTRGLDKQQAGLFFSSTAVFLLATSVGQLGTNTALVYFVARSRSLSAGQLVQPYVRTAHRAVLGTAVMAAGALLVLAEPLAQLIAGSAAAVEDMASYLRVFAVFIPFAGYENVTLAATRGLGSMRTTVLVEQVLRTGVQLALVSASILLLHGAGLGWWWALSYLPAAVMSGRAWRRFSRTVTPKTGSVVDRRALQREFWRFSLPRALASVGQQAVQRLDIILIGAISGPAAAAVYTASTRFLVAGQMVNRAISTAVQPRLSEALAHDDRQRTNELYRVATGWLTILTWPIFLSLIVHGDRLLSIFGRGYSAGGAVLDVLSVAMLWGMACGMVDMVLNMGGRTTWNLMNVLVAFGINIGVDLWLIPPYSYLGAAIGWAAAIVSTNTLALLQVALRLGLHPFGRTTLLSLGLPTGCFLLLPLALRQLVPRTTPGALLALGVSCLLYAVLTWVARRPLQLDALVGGVRPRARRGAPVAQS